MDLMLQTLMVSKMPYFSLKGWNCLHKFPLTQEGLENYWSQVAAKKFVHFVTKGTMFLIIAFSNFIPRGLDHKCCY